MHYGFPHRCPTKEIVERYAQLLPPDFRRYRPVHIVSALMQALDKMIWDFGCTCHRRFVLPHFPARQAWVLQTKHKVKFACIVLGAFDLELKCAVMQPLPLVQAEAFEIDTSQWTL
eukprot:3160344-Amphidinium_carterae.1